MTFNLAWFYGKLHGVRGGGGNNTHTKLSDLLYFSVWSLYCVPASFFGCRKTSSLCEVLHLDRVSRFVTLPSLLIESCLKANSHSGIHIEGPKKLLEYSGYIFYLHVNTTKEATFLLFLLPYFCSKFLRDKPILSTKIGESFQLCWTIDSGKCCPRLPLKSGFLLWRSQWLVLAPNRVKISIIDCVMPVKFWDS